MAKKIITLEEQKFLVTNFPDLFQNLTTQEISVILERLGLDQAVDPDGNVIARYNLDVASSRATYITKDFNTILTGILYNYYQEASDKVTSWKWTRDSGNIAEDSDWSVGKNTREISLTEEDFTTRFKDRDVSFTLTAYIGAVAYIDKIVFTKFQTFSKVQIKSSNTVFIESTPSIITLEAITEETISNYRWFVNNNFVGVGKIYNLSPIQVPAGGIVTIKVEADTLLEETITDILTIPRISNGDNGEPGVPGAPGSNSYTWIRYADNAEGLNMSEYPIVLGVPKEYLGLAPNKNTPIESNNPSDYIWSKYVGDEGIPGKNSYMWIKYSEFKNGRNLAGEIKMYDTPFIMEEDEAGGLVREDMVYMGIAYNKQTQQEANPNTPEGAPEQYVWARIKGVTGPQGINGTSGPSPRLLEFVQGQAYKNGGLYIDYAYYRSNDVNEGWYTVKLPTGHTPGTEVSQIYAGGIPDNTKFNKAPFSKEMSFGTVVAEQANLAGFLFRNQVLQSQTGSKMVACHPELGQHKPNLSLDGLSGVIKFLDRMVMDKTGIILKDDCGKRRMAFQWGLAGVPILKFFAEDGITVTWEAGKNGFQDYITTVPESYTPLYAFYKASTPDGSFLEGRAVFTSANMCSVSDVYSPSGKAYYYRQPNTPEEIKGYYYDKGVQPIYLPAQEDGDKKFFTTADYNGTLVPDGWYLRSFSTFTEDGENKTKGLWTKITAGIEGEQLEVVYADDPTLPTCTPTQMSQWQTEY